VSSYEGCIDKAEYSTHQLMSSSLVLFGTTLCIDKKCIAMDSDKIYINSANPTGEAMHMNFASCWSSWQRSAIGFVGIADKIMAPHMLLPLISFVAIPRRKEEVQVSISCSISSTIAEHCH
jgi:hypothetical protein